MSLLPFLIAVQKNPIAHAIAETNHLFTAGMQIIHVMGFILLLAPLFLAGLRLMGLVLREYPVVEVLRQPRNLSGLGLAMTLGSGIMMFLSAPLHYYYNWAFDTKMVLLLISLTVYGVFVLGILPRAASVPVTARIAVSLSVLLWISVCMAARAIGFVA